MIKLSACMIVKNEEDQIRRCLESIKNVIDEIIIVDTGSIDKTVEISREYTDKIYFHEWENDFSKHRNQSISYATGDWILIIDADEELVTNREKSEIIETFSNIPGNINAVIITMEDIQNNRMVMRCNSARFFRKDKFYYKGIVHNQPVFEGSSGIFNDLIINHYGYDLSKDKMEEKFNRTLQLLLKQYEEKENPHVEFYLCQLYGQRKIRNKSQEWGEKYYKKRDELGDLFNQTAYFTLTKSYMDSDDFERAWDIIKDFIDTDKQDPDMGLAISDFGAKQNNLDIMAIGCRKYLKDTKFFKENPPKMGGKFFFSMREDVETLILYRLCMVCFNEGVWSFGLINERKHLLDKDTQEELNKNMHNLGLSFLLEKDNNYQLPKLMAC
jgi:glycosyltransferase involved in cell wall biosynthesis